MDGSEITRLSIQFLTAWYPELVSHYTEIMWIGLSRDADLVRALNDMQAQLKSAFGTQTRYMDVSFEEAQIALGLGQTEIPEAFLKAFE